MVDLTYMIVRRLLRDDDVGFSRNKNYDAYDDPKVQRAARIYRILRSLERELLEVTPAQLSLGIAPGALTIHIQTTEHRRESVVTPPEWELLVESQEVANLLRPVVSELTTMEQRELERAGFLGSF